MLGVLFLGFLLGVKHALEADHVAAVATLATHSASLPARVKLAGMWGVGHAVTLLLLGGMLLVLDLSPPERVVRMLEGIVGLVLIVLGADVLRRLRTRGVHLHWHRHDGGSAYLHAHAHDMFTPCLAHHAHEHPQRVLPRALLVGSLHGIAGSAALVVLSLELTQSTVQALLYLATFGVGSVAGMAALSLAISIPMRLSSHRLGRAWRMVEGALGMVTIGLGCWMARSFFG